MVEFTSDNRSEPLWSAILHPEIIEPPQGFAGFYWLNAALEDWDNGKGFIIPSLDRERELSNSYMAIPDQIPGYKSVRAETKRLEDLYGGDRKDHDAARVKLHEAISSYLKSQGWVKETTFLPSKWFSGDEKHAYQGGWFLPVKQDGGKAALYEPAPGIYLPSDAHDPEKTIRERGGWNVEKLRTMISVQHFVSFFDPRGSMGRRWMAEHDVEDDFAITEDRGGEWVFEKTLPTLVRYLAIRFDALVELNDLRSGNPKFDTIRVIFKDDTNIGSFKGSHKWGDDQHIKVLERILEQNGINKHFIPVVDFSRDKVKHSKLRLRLEREGYLDMFPEGIFEGFEATLWSTTDCIPRYKESVEELGKALEVELAKPSDVSSVAKVDDHPYVDCLYKYLSPGRQIVFDEPFDEELFTVLARGIQRDKWLEVKTEDGLTYKFITVEPKMSKQYRVIGTVEKADGVIDGFVGVLPSPVVGEPFKFTEYASFKLADQTTVLENLRYANRYDAMQNLHRSVIEAYSGKGDAWKVEDVNLETQTANYLKIKTFGAVASVAMGRYPEA